MKTKTVTINKNNLFQIGSRKSWTCCSKLSKISSASWWLIKRKKHVSGWKKKICFQSDAILSHMVLRAVIYSHALPHYVPQLSECQILLPRCLSRSLSVCSGLAKVTRTAEGSLQPWAANWPGNVCSPVLPPTFPIVSQPDTEHDCH